MTAISQPRTRSNPAIGRWRIEYASGDGDAAVAFHTGKLVLQDQWTLVLDPDTNGVIFASPNVSVAYVKPAG